MCGNTRLKMHGLVQCCNHQDWLTHYQCIFRPNMIALPPPITPRTVNINQLFNCIRPSAVRSPVLDINIFFKTQLFSGFHLSGEIVPGRSTQSPAFTSTEQEIKYKVSVSFDR